ncbi:MAG TPA: hypothetical protein P5298_03240 [Spirochaetia bacterium]|nr:hypothetical protein [Spirochaetia bacterium]
MSVIGLVFYLTLGGNVMVQWGLIPSGKRGGAFSASTLVAFLAAAALASLAHGLAFRYLLSPWGLESLAPILFSALLFGAFAALKAIRTALGKPSRPLHDEGLFPTTLVLYAVALSIGSRFSSTWLLLVGGAAAALGYVAATGFLEAIMERLELERVPEPFRGAPLRFLSAALMALAFAGVDAGFFSRLSI